MASYRVVVTEVHPNGDLTKRSCREIFSKVCLYVGEANDLLKAKKEEYLSTPTGKNQYTVHRETC